LQFDLVEAELYPLSPAFVQARTEEFARKLSALDTPGGELVPCQLRFRGGWQMAKTSGGYKAELDDVMRSAERVVAVLGGEDVGR
jgi:hypothetical protein